MALQTYEDTLCPGCGQPKTLAWHDFSQPTWEHTEFVCHGCTAMAAGQERTYTNAHSTATDEDRAGWPEFAFGETTTDPKPPDNG